MWDAPAVTSARRRLLKCYLESNLNRARFWLHAGDHVEPEEEIRNRAYLHAHDSDLPSKPLQKSKARFRIRCETALQSAPSTVPQRAAQWRAA